MIRKTEEACPSNDSSHLLLSKREFRVARLEREREDAFVKNERRVQSDRMRAFRKPSKFGPLFWALAIQAAIIFVAGFIVIFIPSDREEPVFVAKKTIYLPQRQLDHRMAVAEFQEAAKAPMLMEKVAVDAMLPDSLPNLPEMPTMEFNPIPAQAVGNASAMFGSSGFDGMLAGFGSEASSVSFLGIEDSATRIVILVDISQSVKTKVERAGMRMEEIRDESIRLVEQLNANTLFGLIQLARNYDVMNPYLLPATVENKELALDYLRNRFVTTGVSSGWKRYDGRNGIDAVLEAAFDLEPEVIFLLADGDFQRTPQGGGHEQIPWSDVSSVIDRRQASLKTPARIHVIGFEVPAQHRRDFRAIARGSGGKYKEF